MMTFSTRLRNLNTEWMIFDISNDLTALLMSFLRAVIML